MCYHIYFSLIFYKHFNICCFIAIAYTTLDRLHAVFLYLIEGLSERTKHLDIFFPPVTQWCSVSDVLFTGGRGVSDFSVLKYY